MANIKRRKIDTSIEKQILIGMVVSTEFLQGIRPMYRPAMLELKYASIVAEWCFGYFDKYEKAPKADIEHLFFQWCKENDNEELETYLGEFLVTLSDVFDADDKFNVPYWIDMATEHFNLRNSHNLVHILKGCLASGDMKGVEEALNEHRKVEKIVSEGIDPFDNRNKIKEAFSEKTEPLFTLPGRLGKLINPELTRDAFVAIMGPEKRGKCIVWDSPIHLADGSMQTIMDVVNNKIENIITFNETTKKFEPSKVTDFYYNGLKESYEVITKTGRKVKVTGNHPFLTPSGWKEILDIKLGERIAVPKVLPFFGNKLTDKHTLRLFAYLIAEGGLTNGITFTSSYDLIRKDMEECVKPHHCKMTWIPDTITGHVVGNGTLFNNQVATMLRDVGLWGCHSREKFIPDFIFTQTREGLVEFLKTLFTCDGSIYNDGVEYSSASEKLIYQIQTLLTRFGIVSKVKYKRAMCGEKGFDHWTISIRDTHNIKLFIAEIGFNFHKKEKAEQVLDLLLGKSEKSFLDVIPTELVIQIREEMKAWAESTGGTLQSRFGKSCVETINAAIRNNKPLMRMPLYQTLPLECLPITRSILESDILWDVVDCIIPIGKRLTYDLTVATHHNFVASNCLVHNTWWLMFFAMMARRARCKVAFFQAGDMSENQMIRRMMIYLAQKSDRAKYCGELFIPVLDCVHNQEDTCDRKERKCDFGVDTKEFDFDPDYIPCSVCSKDTHYKSPFKGAVWYKKRPPVTPLSAREAYEISKKNKRQTRAEAFKLATYPNRSLNVSGIINQLRKWERLEGFVPDVILIDYPDIMAPEVGSKEFRHQQNETWMALRGLSQIYHACVIVPTQASASSYTKESVERSDYSEDKRKYAHVTAMYALNQTPDEKKMGIMRIAPILVREDDYDEKYNVRVLQCLQIGRPYMASY